MGSDSDQSQSPEPADTWDCIDPCALLILKFPFQLNDDEIKETLFKFGWTDESGNPDTQRAMRERDRYNRTNETGGSEPCNASPFPPGG